ncbi:MAG: ATP-binding cassette domain-containing protein, partial [Planctomycetota bacterium]
NHLDIEVIQKLEESLQRFRGALVFVTHDRSFLRRLSTRILDLDRGDLRSYRCDYATYLARREVELEAESEERLQFDKKLAKEEAWIRRGVKARRARNQGRVRALHKLREERLARRERTGGMRAQLQESDRTGQLVLKADHVCKSYDSKVVIDDYNVIISRKDRIGIIGPNGCGKSTLLKLLLGELEPDSGTIKRGTKFEVAHFDQLHSTLDDSKTVEENVGQGSDKIEVGGGTRHIMGYLQDFLFTPEQIRGPIRKLSGGERNRLQLAKILAKPCNVLVMDEPTNDLDVETLELLEAMLAEFGGTLLLVSHDREFLNNVVTSTIAFDDDGVVREYDGGYDDWLRQRPVANKAGGKGRGAAKAGAASAPGKKPRRLNNKERAELENLPNKIVEFESEVAELNDRMAAPDFYKRKAKDITAARKRMASLEQKMEAALERWTELEAIAEAAKKK